MIFSQNYSPDGLLDHSTIQESLAQGLTGKFTGQKILVLVPDHTRSIPLPILFPMIVEILRDTRQLDFMVALGTHPPLSKSHLLQMFGITAWDYATKYSRIGIFNHNWEDPLMLATLGVMQQDEIKMIAGVNWHPTLPDTIEIRVNKLALEYDIILILGPTFPHEVVGFSGGAKYLFPGISGPEMINATHWLGALAGVVGTIGIKDTPVRAMIHAAAQRLNTPLVLAALIVDGHELAGIVVGDAIEAWSRAADLSAKRHIRLVDAPFQRVLSCAPAMYDELWTAAKAMYKLEPAVEVGGEVIIYAPHLDIVSHTHGRYIYEVGYHILPYFLQNWDQFRHVPLGVLAHSTHVRGSGVMENDVERPNVRVTLSSRISAEDCARLNLGYLNPAEVNVETWKNREEEGILYVAKAGEILYRKKSSA